jgi:hypothetical protein
MVQGDRPMIRKRLVLVLMGLILTTVTARAEDEPTRQEVDQLKRRIEELKKTGKRCGGVR